MPYSNFEARTKNTPLPQPLPGIYLNRMQMRWKSLYPPSTTVLNLGQGDVYELRSMRVKIVGGSLAIRTHTLFGPHIGGLPLILTP